MRADSLFRITTKVKGENWLVEPYNSIPEKFLLMVAQQVCSKKHLNKLILKFLLLLSLGLTSDNSSSKLIIRKKRNTKKENHNL